VIAEDGGGDAAGAEHGVEGGVDPGGFDLETHVRGEEDSDAERLGEEERVSGLEATLTQEICRIDEAVAGQGQAEDSGLGGWKRRGRSSAKSLSSESGPEDTSGMHAPPELNFAEEPRPPLPSKYEWI
jgi:hypothetical protein